MVDKAAHRQIGGHPGVLLDLLDLLADVFIQVMKGVELDRGLFPRLPLEPGAKFFVSESHHSAIGVVDDEELLRAE
jgi:hypothetical protein